MPPIATLILLAALAQPAPPVIAHIPHTPAISAAPAPAQIDVRVAGDRAILWEGTLRVSPTAGANITQNRSEAAPDSCTADPRRGSNVSTSLRLALRVGSDRGGGSLYSVDVNWTRPGSADQCPTGGTRGVHLEQAVVLAPGQAVTLRGDAGLTVELRRRPDS